MTEELKRYADLRRHRAAFSTGGVIMTAAAVLILVVIVLAVGRSMARRQAGKGRATRELEQIQKALAGYHSEYGTYPPTDFVRYEYESISNQTAWFRTVFLPRNNDPNWPEFFSDMNRTNWPTPGVEGWHLNYKYGLCSFLYPRDRGVNVHWYERDAAKDIVAKNSWSRFIDKLPLFEPAGPYMPPPTVGQDAPYSNEVMTLRDPWGEEYRYVSPPPYSQYRLWSTGPDRRDGTGDDIHRDSK